MLSNMWIELVCSNVVRTLIVMSPYFDRVFHCSQDFDRPDTENRRDRFTCLIADVRDALRFCARYFNEVMQH